MAELAHLIEQCTPEEREQILAAAYYVAFADGRFWREAALMDRIRRELDVPAKTARRLKNLAAGPIPKLTVPEGQSARQVAYHYALAVAAADGKIRKREREIAEVLGDQLGLSNKEVAAELNVLVPSEEPSRRRGRRHGPNRPQAAKPDNFAAMLAGLVGKDSEAQSPLLTHFTSPSVIAVLMANLVPIFGVLLFGWDVFSIVLLYWLENAVVGFYTIPKIVLGGLFCREGPSGSPAGENDRVAHAVEISFLVPFFVFHYGGFMLVHGLLLFGLFGEDSADSPLDLLAGVQSELSGAMAVGVGTFFIQHGFLFCSEYLGKRKYLAVPGPAAMFWPYPRIFVLHVAIVLGAFPAAFLELPSLFLILLIVLKTGLDLFFPFWSRELLSP